MKLPNRAFRPTFIKNEGEKGKIVYHPTMDGKPTMVQIPDWLTRLIIREREVSEAKGRNDARAEVRHAIGVRLPL